LSVYVVLNVFKTNNILSQYEKYLADN